MGTAAELLSTSRKISGNPRHIGTARLKKTLLSEGDKAPILVLWVTAAPF